MTPSILFNLPAVRPRAMVTSVVQITIGRSTFLFFTETAIGDTSVVRPIIQRVLKILEPTTFPTDMSAFPAIAPVRLTTSSGQDVPKPTIVRPMTNSLTRKRRAMEEAPSTRESAPKTIRQRPTMRNNKDTDCIISANITKRFLSLGN